MVSPVAVATQLVAYVYDGDALPAGCRVIGQGRSRLAVLGPDGAVYKVPCDTCAEASGIADNRREARLFAAIEGRSFSPGHVNLIEIATQYGDSIPVLRMPYIEADGSEPANLQELLEWLAEHGALDINGGNWIVRDGRAIVVDVAGV